MCSGCGSPILDQFILRVAPDLEWHASCLKCADCGLMLEEMRTCFVRDGKTYCKMDYLRSAGAAPTARRIFACITCSPIPRMFSGIFLYVSAAGLAWLNLCTISKGV